MGICATTFIHCDGNEYNDDADNDCKQFQDGNVNAESSEYLAEKSGWKRDGDFWFCPDCLEHNRHYDFWRSFALFQKARLIKLEKLYSAVYENEMGSGVWKQIVKAFEECDDV